MDAEFNAEVDAAVLMPASPLAAPRHRRAAPLRPRRQVAKLLGACQRELGAGGPLGAESALGGLLARAHTARAERAARAPPPPVAEEEGGVDEVAQGVAGMEVGEGGEGGGGAAAEDDGWETVPVRKGRR